MKTVLQVKGQHWKWSTSVTDQILDWFIKTFILVMIVENVDIRLLVQNKSVQGRLTSSSVSHLLMSSVDWLSFSSSPFKKENIFRLRRKIPVQSHLTPFPLDQIYTNLAI